MDTMPFFLCGEIIVSMVDNLMEVNLPLVFA